MASAVLASVPPDTWDSQKRNAIPVSHTQLSGSNPTLTAGGIGHGLEEPAGLGRPSGSVPRIQRLIHPKHAERRPITTPAHRHADGRDRTLVRFYGANVGRDVEARDSDVVQIGLEGVDDVGTAERQPGYF